METQVKLTKLATCAGCGAKMGAGTLALSCLTFAGGFALAFWMGGKDKR